MLPPAKVIAVLEVSVILIVLVPAEKLLVLFKTVPVPERVKVYELPAKVPAEMVRVLAVKDAPMVLVPDPEEVKILKVGLPELIVASPLPERFTVEVPAVNVPLDKVNRVPDVPVIFTVEDCGVNVPPLIVMVPADRV